MTKYILKLTTPLKNGQKLCVVRAEDKKEAKAKTQIKYGGEWRVLDSYSTLTEVKNSVEDSPKQSVVFEV